MLEYRIQHVILQSKMSGTLAVIPAELGSWPRFRPVRGACGRTKHARTHKQTRAHGYTHTHSHTHAHMDTHTHTQTRAHSHTHTHTRARAHSHKHTPTHTHTHTHTHTSSMDPAQGILRREVTKITGTESEAWEVAHIPRRRYNLYTLSIHILCSQPRFRSRDLP